MPNESLAAEGIDLSQSADARGGRHDAGRALALLLFGAGGPENGEPRLVPHLRVFAAGTVGPHSRVHLARQHAVDGLLPRKLAIFHVARFGRGGDAEGNAEDRPPAKPSPQARDRSEWAGPSSKPGEKGRTSVECLHDACRAYAKLLCLNSMPSARAPIGRGDH